MPKSQYHFLIKEKELFRSRSRSMREKSGDLIIVPHRGTNRLDGPREASSEENILHERRYSIHRSEKSPTGVNLIKETVRTGREPAREFYAFTKAIRTKSKFALVQSKRAGPSELVHSGGVSVGRDVVLPNCDDEAFIPVYSLFVGRVGELFNPMLSQDSSTLWIDTGYFRLVLVVSFFLARHIPVDFVIGTETGHPDIVQMDIVQRQQEGMSPNECMRQFRYHRLMAKLDYASTLKGKVPVEILSNYLKYIRGNFFLKEGVAETKEFERMERKCGWDRERFGSMKAAMVSEICPFRISTRPQT